MQEHIVKRLDEFSYMSICSLLKSVKCFGEGEFKCSGLCDDKMGKGKKLVCIPVAKYPFKTTGILKPTVIFLHL